MFAKSAIESIELPSTLRRIEAGTFATCERLKHVAFASGSKVESVGFRSFFCSGIEDIIIPKGVAEIQKCTFKYCWRLK